MLVGDFSISWRPCYSWRSFDYVALVLEDLCYTWRCLLLVGDLESVYLGGALRFVVLHLERTYGGFFDDLDALIDDMEALLC